MYLDTAALRNPLFRSRDLERRSPCPLPKAIQVDLQSTGLDVFQFDHSATLHVAETKHYSILTGPQHPTSSIDQEFLPTHVNTGT